MLALPAVSAGGTLETVTHYRQADGEQVDGGVDGGLTMQGGEGVEAG